MRYFTLSKFFESSRCHQLSENQKIFEWTRWEALRMVSLNFDTIFIAGGNDASLDVVKNYFQNVTNVWAEVQSEKGLAYSIEDTVETFKSRTALMNWWLQKMIENLKLQAIKGITATGARIGDWKIQRY